MQKTSVADARNPLLLCVFVLGVMAALVILPLQFRTEAGGRKGLFLRTESHQPGLENYDIRTDKGEEIDQALAKYRNGAGKDSASVADIRGNFVRGEERLRLRVPTVKTEYNTDIRIPEVITPDVWKGRIERLSSPSTARRSEILRDFVKEYNDLVGVNDDQADQLKVTADYTNPDGNLSFAHLEQRINGVPVFRGEIKAGFTKSGEMIRVINNLAPGIDYESVSADFRNPADAVLAAFRNINAEPTKLDREFNPTASTDLRAVFGNGDWATTAEKMYFPTEPGVAVPAWRVLIWQPVNAYYVIVDNEGRMLWRKNITEDQTQSSTYEVYRNANAYVDLADSPAPLSPGPVDPTTGTQGALLTRTNMTLIGNEGSNSFNNNGWITDGGNTTDGNAVEAGIDRDGTNGVDAPQTGSPSRVFDSTWNPGPGNPAPGDDPLTTQAQRGAVIQMFYAMNRYHDELYKRGFTEQAFNFQTDNFGRGGAGADRVSAEGQDSSGTNNANFSTPADGGRGRMQMYVWTGPTPDYDGTGDAEVIYHEVTHGTSNRLHGNSSGLSTNMARGMGEGWSDWYAEAMLSEPTDPVDGVYTTGGYATYLIAAGFTGNYYYGIRRFPRAPITFVGANGKPHNPFTFRYVNSDCNTLIGTTTSNPPPNSAFPRGPIGVTTCDQVHNLGEVWSSALWEVRNRMVTRLGHTAGTQRVLQVVTDGMKLAPIGPTFLQERDAIISAASALSLTPEAPADVLDVREGFRVRGMGYSASIQNAGTGANNTAVTEAFDSADVAANNGTVTSGNGLLEPNECNTLNVPVVNNSANTATGITAVLTSNTPGITVNQGNSAYPDIPGGGGPVNNITPFQVSVDNTVACYTSASFTLTVSFTGGGGGSPIVKNFSLPIGIPGNAYTFTAGTGTIPAGGTLVAGSQADDGQVSIPLPSGWSSMIYDVPVSSLSASTNGMLTANATASTTFTNAVLPAAVGTGGQTMFPYWDDMILTTARSVDAGIFTNTIGTAPNRQLVVEWRAQHFNGGTAETGITFNFAAVLTEGTSQIDYIYTTVGATANTNGSSATVGVQKATTGTDFTQYSFNQSVITPGMKLTGTLPPGQCTTGGGTCNFVPADSRADFDGDGKTDVSVFRGSEGNWYLNRSTDGFQVLNWGLASDALTPGDYDDDGKADTAVFRANADSAQPDFYILNSNGFTVTGASWGLPGDTPVVADYDGDGKDDVAVFRPSNNTWYVINSGGAPASSITVYGQAGDVPVAGDFDGDGKGDLSVYRSGTWLSQLSGGGTSSTALGAAGDVLVPADYDGDNKDDVAVFRPSTGTWYVVKSTDASTLVVPFGTSGDVPVPGDYDGDGKDDFAIYRNGQWWINASTSGVSVTNFGIATDKPIPRSYVP